ncbi:MAG: hypothetical protein E7651_06595 [Ruminococcaceae bacterium]|nr:hypothetical protein [Oscillospiraceae bacterium]
MKNNAKRISSICCLVLSIGFLGGFGYSFATFLITTAATAPSFAEAAKNLLLFLASAFGTFGTLCIGAVFAYVSALLGEGKLKKASKALFILQLTLLFFFLVVLVSMNIVLPEGTV